LDAERGRADDYYLGEGNGQAERLSVTSDGAVERLGFLEGAAYMAQLESAGAYKDGAGNWRIPLDALRAAGLSPGRPAPPDADADMAVRQRDSDADNVSQLRQEMAELRLRAEVAEALASERERVIEAQAQTLRMLGAGSGKAPQPPQGPLGWLRRQLAG